MRNLRYFLGCYTPLKHMRRFEVTEEVQFVFLLVLNIQVFQVLYCAMG